MKKIISALAIIIAVSGFSVTGFAQKNTTTTTQTKDSTVKVKAEKKTALKQYTCPMHPEVLSTKPGKCPICGMRLEEKKVAKK
jgi:hypothetical protein